MTQTGQARRAHVLAAALGVFGRHGYQKTSMNEVAKAAGISRPNLYLHFSNKETLFLAALEHELSTAFAEASRQLEADSPLGRRVAAALDAWLGRYVGSALGVGIDSLLESPSMQLAGMISGYHEKFEELLSRSIAESSGNMHYRSAGVTPSELAIMLIAVGRGAKDYTTSRAEFSVVVGIATRLAFSAPG